MASPTTNTTAYWGTTFEEFAHNDAIPLTADYFDQRHLQGATTPDPGYSSNGPTRHQAVSLSALGLPTPPSGVGDKAMRIAMPASGGVTSRYQLEFWTTQPPGADYWIAWWEMLGTDWNLATSQLASNGSTFVVVGHSNRNAGTDNNGPLCYNCDVTTRRGVGERQAGLNLVGDVSQNGDGALQRGILDTLRKDVWCFWEVHYRWSRSSDGIVEFYRTIPSLSIGPELVHTITGQNLQAAATGVYLRYGLYQGGGINHARTMYCGGIQAGPTRASVQMGTAEPPPPATNQLRDFSETFDTGGSLMPTRQGLATVANGQLSLALDAGTSVSSAASLLNLDVVGDGVIAHNVQFPVRTANDGAFVTYFTVDFANGNRAVLRRRIVVSSGSVTVDDAEAYLRIGEVDSTPVIVPWSDLPANVRFLKLGFDPGNVSYQAAAESSTGSGTPGAFTEFASRTIDTALQDDPAGIAMGVLRESGTVTVTTLATSEITGTATPGPTLGGDPTSGAHTLAGTQIYSFPRDPGTALPTTFLVLGRRSTGASNSLMLRPVGHSKDGINFGRVMDWMGSTDATYPSHLRLEDAMQTPVQSPGGAQVLPAAGTWILTAVSESATGQLTARLWNATTGAFTHAANFTTIPAGATITSANARFAVGASIPANGAAIPGSAFRGEVAMVAQFDHVLTTAEFESIVSENGIVTRQALEAISGLLRLYEFSDDPANAVVDVTASNADEILGERKGTPVAYVTVDVPYDPNATAPPPPPPPAASVPQATGFTITNAVISSGGMTGEATLTVGATSADSSISYTPHAQPYGFFSSPDGITWTQLGAWQASTSKALTGIALDAPLFYSARYRSDATPPLEGSLAPAHELVIPSTGQTLSAVTGVVGVPSNGGTMTVYWDPNPASENVTEYDVFVIPAGDTPNLSTPNYAGLGGTVSGGAYDGKLTFTPAVSGLDDAASHDIWVRAHRTAA